jgi:glycosyltransferase involved in cell wall biosynthesis
MEAQWRQCEDVRAAFPEVAHGRTERYWSWLLQSDQPRASVIRLLEVDQFSSTRSSMAVPVLGRDRRGVDVVGYLAAEVGTGEAGRLVVNALTAAGIPVSSISRRAIANRASHPFVSDEASRYDTVLMAINADELGHVRDQFGDDFFGDRYVIGQWFWEVAIFPEHLTGAFPMVHEVWVATEHIRRALEAWSPAQAILVMPLPLMAPPVRADIGKADFGLDDRFMFLFSFDFGSVFERKNPLAVIEAFSTAFREGEGPILVIKTINGRDHQHELEHLRWKARRRTDIIVRDGYLDLGMIGALTASCDCYVSLHRAEGLGLTMSEAMALGKPVIATAYSGNMDFMTPESAYLVPWETTRIGPKAAPYPADGTWAEPDIGVAAQLMRTVVEDPAGAANIGAAGQLDLATRFSPEATGLRMRQRLEAVWAARDA